MHVCWQAHSERSSQPSMRRSASSPEETLKGNLKYDEKRRIFNCQLRGVIRFIWWRRTVSRMLDISSQTKSVLEGKIKDAKTRVFHLSSTYDYQRSWWKIQKHTMFITAAVCVLICFEYGESWLFPDPVGATYNSYRSIVFAYNRALHMHGYLMIEMNKRASAKTGDVEKLRQNLKKLTKNISPISCRCKNLSAFEKAVSLLAFF